MKNRELFLALDQLENEYKIDKQLLIASLEAGLASAFKKESGESRAVAVRMNPETYTIEFFAYQNAVVGELIGEEVSPDDLSRIAAQTAKQVITQRINEAKREQVMSEMNEKEGELMQAVVRRVEPTGTVSVEIVGTQMEGILTTGEQVRGERLAVGDKIKVYIKKVRTDSKGTSRVMVSRACAGFVRKLFEIEVPEIRSNLVKIKNIVREAGLRTKLSVYSDDPNIDSIGSCIGPKGSRVNAIINELNGEKVDVILYSSNPSEYIVRALSPAKVLMVQLNETDMQAKVVVPDDKLSLAIGKGGQNAKLAAKLTGYKIDVKPYSEVIATLSEEDIEEESEE